MQYSDSLYIAEKNRDAKYNALQVKLVSGQMEIQQSKLEMAQAEKEKALLKFRYSTILFLTALLAFVGFWLFYQTRQRKKEERAMFLHNEQVAEQKLQRAKEEINHFIGKINEQNKLSERFREELKNLKSIETEERHRLEKTIANLRSSKILTDDNWLDFQRHFALIYPAFLPKLKQHYPGITEAELRYLLLSKLQLSHKEMAQALGISADAVRVTWNRVRKKIGGGLQDTPQSLLEKIS